MQNTREPLLIPLNRNKCEVELFVREEKFMRMKPNHRTNCRHKPDLRATCHVFVWDQ